MLKGQCLCGAIRYRYEEVLKEVIICHCLDCKKAQGTSFAYNSPIDQKFFVLEAGIDALKEFFFTPNKARVFCRHCASPIYSYRKDLPGVMRLRLGTVTEGHVPFPNEEIFTEHRQEYLNITLIDSEK